MIHRVAIRATVAAIGPVHLSVAAVDVAVVAEAAIAADCQETQLLTIQAAVLPPVRSMQSQAVVQDQLVDWLVAVEDVILVVAAVAQPFNFQAEPSMQRGRAWGFLRQFHRGFLPSCRTCNAFSITNNCSSCSMGPSCGSAMQPAYGRGGGTEVYFGGAGSGGVVDGCTSCAQHSVVPGPALASQRPGRIPHQVVTKQIQMAHGRPPHKLVANRLANQLR